VRDNSQDGAAKVALGPDDPWPGLNAFDEASAEYFYGRFRESTELAHLVQRELLSVLFGQSGSGKSSLLRAGLFPVIRPKGFFPIYIRLHYNDRELSLTEQVFAELNRAIQNPDCPIDAPPPEVGESLWEYFHRQDVDWWDGKNNFLKPVLVFDQFEEILTVGRTTQGATARTEAFLTELEDLIGEHVPETLQERLARDPEWRNEFHKKLHVNKRDFRIILTLREDFLAELESVRERLRGSLLNRFRLLRMTADQAYEVITKPAPGLVSEQVALEIIHHLSFSEREQPQPTQSRECLKTQSIEPALLSLYCTELNRRRKSQGLPKFSSSLISGTRSEILAGFYENAFSGLPEKVREFVEDRLLTVSGSRNMFPIEDALATPEVTSDRLATLVDRRLIHKVTTVTGNWIELSHDIVADVARASQKTRQQRQRYAAEKEAIERQILNAKVMARRQARRLTVAVLLACFFLGLTAVLVWLLIANTQKDKEITSQDEQMRTQATLIGQQDAQIRKGQDQLNAQREIEESQSKDLAKLHESTEAARDELNRLTTNYEAYSRQIIQLRAERENLIQNVNDLKAERDQLASQLGRLRDDAENVVRNMAAKLTEANQLASVSLQDKRARLHAILDKDQVAILQNAFQAVNHLLEILSGKEASGASDVIRRQMLMAETRSLAGVLSGDLDVGLQECDSALDGEQQQSTDLSTELSGSKAQILKLRGNIYASKAFLIEAEKTRGIQDKGWQEENSKKAIADLLKALDLMPAAPAFQADVLSSLSEVERRLSYDSTTITEVRQHRLSALRFVDQAEKLLERELQNAPADGERSMQLHSLLATVYRKAGNIEFESVKKGDLQMAEQKSAILNAVKLYGDSIKQAGIEERSTPEGKQDSSVHLVTLVGRVFSEANLADTCELALRQNLVERGRLDEYRELVTKMLSERIETCFELVKAERERAYFRSLLSQGFENRGKYYLDRDNKIAFEDLRVAYLLAFPHINKDLESDYETSAEKLFGSKAKEQVSEFNADALKRMSPVILQEASTPSEGTEQKEKK
jgi:archaellum component FlaC